MGECQSYLFNWIGGQPGATGLVFFAAGALYGFAAFRMLRFLLLISTAGYGALAGLITAWTLNYQPDVLVVAGGFLGALIGIASGRAALLCSAAATAATLCGYVASQMGLAGTPLLIVMASCGLLGATCALLGRETTALFITTLQGAGLMIIGFAGLSSAYVPSLGATFRSWASSQSLMIPILLTMVAIGAYAVQASRLQGDICTGK